MVKSWGANLVRFRVLADDYNSAPSGATGNLTRAQIVQRIKDWRDAVVGQGMYFLVCSWAASTAPTPMRVGPATAIGCIRCSPTSMRRSATTPWWSTR